MLAILQAFDGQAVRVSSEPRLREQDFGNFQNLEEMSTVFAERQKFGRFYYRFPNGEAGTDVFDRMASFITYLFRTFGETGYHAGPSGVAPAQNCVLITHGLLMRIFCMCYLRWTVTEFEQVWNPSNCEIWVLNALPGSPKYELAGRWRATPYGGAFTSIKFGEGKDQPLFEHMRRPLTSRLVTPGTPDALDGDELAHLRHLPGPRKLARSEGRNRAMLAGDAVLAYWYGTAKRRQAESEPAGRQEPDKAEASAVGGTGLQRLLRLQRHGRDGEADEADAADAADAAG